MSSGDPYDEFGLAELGLVVGDEVRFVAAGRRRSATVVGRERDGSVALRDERGAARAIPVGRIDVRCTGPRGGKRWEPLTERVERCEQRRLL